MRTKGPYVGDGHGMIWAPGNFHFADIRGWGRLTGIGGRNLPEKEASAIMDANEAFVVSALNAADTGRALTEEQVERLRKALRDGALELTNILTGGGRRCDGVAARDALIAAMKILEAK